MTTNKTPKRLGEWAYQEIKELILKNELIAGQNLSIGSLAKKLDLSQTPIREALGRLHAEGLIVHTAHKKPRVSEITIDDLIETYDARKLLEPQLVIILIRSLSNNKVLQKAVTGLETDIRKLVDLHISEMSIESYLEIDRQLNDLILGPVRKTLTGDLQVIINERSLRFRNYAETFIEEETKKNNMVRQISIEHLNIITAISKRDVVDAKAFTLTHLENSKQRALASIKQFHKKVSED